MRKPSPSMIVALVALFAALSGVGMAANGGNFVLGHANSATLNTSLSAPVAGGKALQVTNTNTSNAASTALGLTVAAGHAPFTVSNAVKVTNLNADMVDGLDSSALRTNAKFYGGRLVTATGSAQPTFLTVPGVAHAIVLSCQAGSAEAELRNDATGTTDIWSNGDTNYLGTNWGGVGTPLAVSGGQTFHIGKGSGPGATMTTVTISTHATGSQCIFQGTAEVVMG